MKFPVLSLTALLAFGGRTTCWINFLSAVDLYSFSLFLFKYVTMTFDSGLSVRRTSRLPVIQDAVVDPSMFTWWILPPPCASKMYKHLGFSEATMSSGEVTPGITNSRKELIFEGLKTSIVVFDSVAMNNSFSIIANPFTRLLIGRTTLNDVAFICVSPVSENNRWTF